MPVLTTLGAATAKAWGFLQQVAAAADPYYKYVTMLLTGNGTNGAQNNTFLDSSSNAFSITRNGNTTQGSFSPYGSLWSNYFNASTPDYVTFSNGSNFAFGTGDFTIEFWFNAGSAANDKFVLDFRSGGSSNNLGITTGGYGSSVAGSLRYFSGAIDISSGSTLICNNQWNHCAIVRNGTTITLYVNGVSTATGTDSSNFSSTSGTIYIARNSYGSGNEPTAYISNLRIVKGTAVYTAAFTPSTTPLTAVSGTSLLTCQSNRFVDNSGNSVSLTLSGTPSVQRFSPFNPTASYSTATIGGSGYFDGNGDYLSLPNNSAFAIGTNDFTFETWAYFTATPNTQIFCTNNGYGTDAPYGYYYFSYEGGAFYSWGGGGGGNTGVSASYTMPLNQWVHLVAVRSGTSHSIFVNGTRIGNATNQQSYTGGTSPLIGARVNYITGYLSDSRFVNGTAVYSPSSSTLTVPTAPLTAVTNTKLLASYTNAGIPDSAMMNDLETVGNAQVSTSVKKFGTGSLYFDGTTNCYLTRPNTPVLYIGPGDFTVEFWVYFNTGSAEVNIASQFNNSGGGPGWTIYRKSNNQIEMYCGTGASGGAVSTTTATTTNTWYYVAFVRSGTSNKVYLNGTLEATATISTFANETSHPFYMGYRGDYPTNKILNGYVDDFRVTNGYARYSGSTMTVPTAAFPTY